MLTRRAFLARCGGMAAATGAVYGLPELLAVRGWYRAAWAQEPDVVLDTLNGLAAMAWPGNDAYSIAQGESSDGPGAVAANAGRHMRDALDGFVPQPDAGGSNDDTTPLSGAITSAINAVALTVNPAATSGAFLSPFARLSFAQKAQTWRVLEEETQTVSGADPSLSLGVLQFVFGVLPGFVQFLAFSEIDTWDPVARDITARPLGWRHCRYLEGLPGPVEGWDELIGYYQDRRSVAP